MELRSKSFVHSQILLYPRTYQSKIDDAALRQKTVENRRPRLIVFDCLAKCHRISQRHDFDFIRPGPGVAETMPVRAMRSGKVSSRENEAIVRLMEMSNVWMRDSEVTVMSLH